MEKCSAFFHTQTHFYLSSMKNKNNTPHRTARVLCFYNLFGAKNSFCNSQEKVVDKVTEEKCFLDKRRNRLEEQNRLISFFC